MRDDKFFMGLALKLAGKGRGKTSPNPVVGAVLVKNGKVVGRGYHKGAGLEHAEIAAIKDAGKKASGATLYVTLEPCNHFGRTGPCTEVIIKSGVRKVVATMRDPNPLNNGKGFRRLRAAGLKVISGVLEKDAQKLNEAFKKYITTKMPFVTVKVAQSLDGKIATKTGDSKWISGEKSRRYVHKLRSQSDAVMVGANTVIRDNPLLTSRISGAGAGQPVKIVVDAGLRTPFTAKIFSDRSPAKVILATSKNAPKKKIEKFEGMGCEVLTLRQKGKGLDLKALMRELAKMEVTNILVEGGGELIGSLTDERLVDKFLFFIAPKIIGGRNAITSVEGRGAEKVRQAIFLKNIKRRIFDDDLLIEADVCSRE